MFRRLIALGLGLGAVVTAIPAHAQDCAERAQVVSRLQQDYFEELTAGGLNASETDTTVIEVWSSPQTGTFTVMSTNADGLTCIIATGTDWFAPKTPGLPQDTAG